MQTKEKRATARRAAGLVIAVLIVVPLLINWRGTLTSAGSGRQKFNRVLTEGELQQRLTEKAELDARYRPFSVSPEQYPNGLLRLALKNEEALEFALGWTTQPEPAAGERIDLSGDIPENGSIPYFLQWDARWGYGAYGSSTVGVSGCGPTCLSMLIVGLRSNMDANPLAVADYSAAQGWYHEGTGTDWELMRSGAAHFGLNWRELPLDEKTMAGALNAGEYIIASVGPGDFTDGGHYLIISGCEDDGFSILDPNSRINSSRTWSFAVLKGQVYNLWAYS